MKVARSARISGESVLYPGERASERARQKRSTAQRRPFPSCPGRLMVCRRLRLIQLIKSFGRRGVTLQQRSRLFHSKPPHRQPSTKAFVRGAVSVVGSSSALGGNATGILTLAPTLPLPLRKGSSPPSPPSPICPSAPPPLSLRPSFAVWTSRAPRMSSWAGGRAGGREGGNDRTDGRTDGRTTDLPIQQVKWLIAPLSYGSLAALSLSMNEWEGRGQPG